MAGYIWTAATSNRYDCTHTLIKTPMHLVPPMQISEITDSAFCKKRARGAGLGAMLVEQGGAADEGGGDSPSSSAFLQLVGVLRRGRCGRAAAATGRGGQTGGTRGRLRLLGLFRLDPGQPTVGEVGLGVIRALNSRALNSLPVLGPRLTQDNYATTTASSD